MKASAFRRPIRSRLLALAMSAGVAALAAGCATPIGVKRIRPEEANRQLTANVLTTGKPGAPAQEFLYRLNLTEQYREDPAGTIDELYAGLGHADESNRLFALAELSFDYAEHGGGRSVLSGVGGVRLGVLVPGESGSAPGLLRSARPHGDGSVQSRRHRQAWPAARATRWISARARVALPYGPLQLDVDPSGFKFGGYQLVHFTSLADFQVRGLRNRYRQRGIGAPLAASVAKSGEERVDRWIAPRAKVPVTALLRFDDPRRGMSERGAPRHHPAVRRRGTRHRPDRRRHRSAGVRNHDHAGLSARRGAGLGLRDRRLPRRRFQLRRRRKTICSCCTRIARAASRWSSCTARRRARHAGPRCSTS